MSVVERSTNTILRSIGFEFNKPIASSDLNVEQSILLNNIIKFMNGKLTNSSLKMTVDEYTDSKPNITITGLKYCVVDASGNVYYGHIEPSIVIKYPGTPASGSIYKLYAYWRAVELTPSSTVYAYGVRTNASQSSIVETTTTNNILDDNLNEEVSNRKGLEITFVAVANGSSAPSLSGWSSAVQVATITLKSDKSSTITHVVPASDVDEHIENTMPHYFMDDATRYKYGFSVSNDHMILNYEEV